MLRQNATLIRAGLLAIFALILTSGIIALLLWARVESVWFYAGIGLFGVLAIALIYGGIGFLLKDWGKPSDLARELRGKGAWGITVYLMLMIVGFSYFKITSIRYVQETALIVVRPHDLEPARAPNQTAGSSGVLREPAPAGAIDQLEPAPSVIPGDPGEPRPAILLPATVIAQTEPASFPWPVLAGGAILGVGIAVAFLGALKGFRQTHVSGIEKAEGVCGGAARIRQTRIPVWQLVEARDMGISDAKLLADYPDLSAQDLVNAWAYDRSHPKEIEGEIRENNEVFEDEVA